MNAFLLRTPKAALIFALSLCLVLVAISTNFLWLGYSDTLSRGRERAEIAAQTVAAHFQWFTEASRQALRRIDDTVAFRPELLQTGTLVDLDEAIASLPGEVHVRLFDANGGQLLSTRPEQGAINISGRGYFRDLRDGKTFVISPQLTDGVTGIRSFVMARRIEREGAFSGVAAIVVPDSLMAGFWSSLALGPNSTISIIRDDGHLVARFPPVDEAVNLSNYVLFTEYLRNAPRGSYTAEASPVDGIGRLVGYSRVDGAPLVALSAVASDTVLADFRARARGLAMGATPLLLCMGLLAWWVARLMRQDETQRRELEVALDENRLLFREVHHRVKNNLQTVASVIQLQNMDQATKRDLRNRILAMAAVHEQIYSRERLLDIDMEGYLRQIVDGIVNGYGSPAVVDLEIEPMNLEPDQALALGLIVTELVSNSLKHSFPASQAGRIVVRLSSDSADEARLDVSDNGRSFDPSASTKGLGLRLIAGFSQQLNGTYELDGAEGLRFSLSFPRKADEGLGKPFPRTTPRMRAAE